MVDTNIFSIFYLRSIALYGFECDLKVLMSF